MIAMRRCPLISPLSLPYPYPYILYKFSIKRQARNIEQTTGCYDSLLETSYQILVAVCVEIVNFYY